MLTGCTFNNVSLQKCSVSVPPDLPLVKCDKTRQFYKLFPVNFQDFAGTRFLRSSGKSHPVIHDYSLEYNLHLHPLRLVIYTNIALLPHSDLWEKPVGWSRVGIIS